MTLKKAIHVAVIVSLAITLVVVPMLFLGEQISVAVGGQTFSFQVGPNQLEHAAPFLACLDGGSCNGTGGT